MVVFDHEYFVEQLSHMSKVLYFDHHIFPQEYKQLHDQNESFHSVNQVLNKPNDLYQINQYINLLLNENKLNVHVVMDVEMFENYLKDQLL